MNEPILSERPIVLPDGLSPFMERAKRYYELKELERLGISPDMHQRQLILTYIALVLKENAALNIIPRSDEDSIFLRHFCDSLQSLLLLGFTKGSVTLDIGSSGGFPVVPIRILRPDLAFIIVEPNNKKAAFLTGMKTILGFDNMQILADKIENIELNQKVDCVINRGVWTLQKLARITEPFLKKGGHVYVYKAKSFTAELEAMTEHKNRGGVQVCEIAQYDLGGGVMQGFSLVSMECIQ